jgi:hypothetical protein
MLKLIRKGHYSEPIFESKGAIIVSCGSNTVISLKPKPERIFTNALDQRTYTPLKVGYYSICTEKEHLISDEYTATMVAEWARQLSSKAKRELLKQIEEDLKEEEKETR